MTSNDSLIINEYNKDLSEIYIERAYVKLTIGDFEGVIDDTSKAILLDPEDPIAFLFRGVAQHGLAKFHLAIKDLTRALELQPDLPMHTYIDVLHGLSLETRNRYEGPSKGQRPWFTTDELI
ncbi:MAG: hypothetical protein A2017_00005 [Lentisphaerae bacterium GWF2_44_16]|nr:MAG: hypothetical protein A2017_00005 [Lentisphaerae bacterium GWF2_44_16]